MLRYSQGGIHRMNKYFGEVKKNFGFGCMRLPCMENGEIEPVQFSEMVDYFIENGFNYFDTAHGYHSGKSETAIRECLVKRHDRSEYTLTDKMTEDYFNSEAEIRPYFEGQLEACGVDYFDFYLMHAQNARNYEKFKACNAYKVAAQLKKEGKVKHVGISFHDNAATLDKILTEQPDIEVVQIQFNYIDYENPSVEGKKCYEVCRKHGKPIIIMEPVKGGSLVNLPDPAKKVLDDLNGGSYASYALRYAASFEGVMMVLSGMSNMEQMRDNLSFMKEFKPFTDEEYSAVYKICEIFATYDRIPCTACRYCTDGCPKKINIPELFSCQNSMSQYHDYWGIKWRYNELTKDGGKASECIKCGKCEKACPQHLEIRKLLEKVAATLEH